MSRPSFEELLRDALVSTAPGDVPMSLERRARSIPATTPARSRWASITTLRPALAAVLVLAVVAVGLAAVAARPPSNGGPPNTNPISFTSPFGSLVASDFELTVGDRTFLVADAASAATDTRLRFAGTPTFGSFEMHWIEHAAPMTFVAYVVGDAHTWWVSEIVASEGRSDGIGWLYFEGPFFEAPRGSVFEGDANLVSSRSTDGTAATLRFGHLRLSAFADGATARDITNGTMPPPPANGGTVDPSTEPDFIAVGAPSQGIGGFAPRSVIEGQGPTNGYVGQPPDVPVYADDLRTLVGYFVIGRGFVSLGALSGQVPPTPQVSTAPSAVPGETPGAAASLNPGELLLATSPPGTAGGDARLEGVLRGEVRDGHACFWIEPTDNPASTPLALIWPNGYHAYGPNLQLNAPDYRVIALVGMRIVLGGAGRPVGDVPSPEEDPCGLGQVFTVAGVVSVGPGPTDLPSAPSLPSSAPSPTTSSQSSTDALPAGSVVRFQTFELRPRRSAPDARLRWESAAVLARQPVFPRV